MSLIGVTVKSNLKLAESCCLNLTCILKSLDPFSLLLLKTINFALDLESLFILLIDASDEVKSLLLSLQSCFLSSQLFLFLFLASYHLFHRLRFEFLSLSLHLNHFFVLLTLLFKLFSFLSVFHVILRLIIVDSIFLLHSLLMISFCLLLHLLFLHSLMPLFGVLCLIVSLSNLHNLDGFLFCLFNLLPCLSFKKGSDSCKATFSAKIHLRKLIKFV